MFFLIQLSRIDATPLLLESPIGSTYPAPGLPNGRCQVDVDSYLTSRSQKVSSFPHGYTCNRCLRKFFAPQQQLNRLTFQNLSQLTNHLKHVKLLATSQLVTTSLRPTKKNRRCLTVVASANNLQLICNRFTEEGHKMFI